MIVEMDALARYRAIIDKYKQLFVDNYKEPGRNGVFDYCTNNVLQDLRQEEDSDSEEEA